MGKRKHQFVDLNYKPRKKDLVCLFRVEPNKISIKEAAHNIALESSIGTWTPVGTQKDYVNKIGARVFHIDKKNKLIKVAYPCELFEGGNMANILSSIAGNIFGMKLLKNLRLVDIEWPKKIVDSFPGPRHGIKGVRKILGVKERPLVGTIVKPKLGLKTKDHAKVAYDAWVGGCDIVKDDENLSSQNFNPFKKRLKETLKMRDRAERKTGEKKVYMINVTAETSEMVKRAKMVEKAGGRYIMVDILTVGFSGLQTLRKNTKLVIHGHRAMHAALTRNKKHGVSMMVLADVSRLVGVDQLHIGTIVGKMEGGFKEIKNLSYEMKKQKIKESSNKLKQNWRKIKPVFAVSSGGLHPGHIPYLIENLGKDIIIQAGGGVNGHPSGSIAGGRAMRQAVDAHLANKDLKEYSKNHDELKQAIDEWGYTKPNAKK